MELIIRDSNKLLTDDFARWLLSKVKIKLIANISRYNVENFDNYLNESNDIKRLYKDKNYRASDIIMFAANNLVYSFSETEIRIHVDFNKYTPGYDRLKINTAAKLINYGTADKRGCPIFTNILNQFAENIQDYISLYYRL